MKIKSIGRASIIEKNRASMPKQAEIAKHKIKMQQYAASQRGPIQLARSTVSPTTGSRGPSQSIRTVGGGKSKHR